LEDYIINDLKYQDYLPTNSQSGQSTWYKTSLDPKVQSAVWNKQVIQNDYLIRSSKIENTSSEVVNGVPYWKLNISLTPEQLLAYLSNVRIISDQTFFANSSDFSYKNISLTMWADKTTNFPVRYVLIYTATTQSSFSTIANLDVTYLSTNQPQAIQLPDAALSAIGLP
jgi:hypothetical protein